MNTDNASTSFLVTREDYGDVRLKMGRTQKFLEVDVHSLFLGNRPDWLPVLSWLKSTNLQRMMEKEKWSGWPDLSALRSHVAALNRQPKDLFRQQPK